MENCRWHHANPRDLALVQGLLTSREPAWASLIDRFLNSPTSWHADFTVLHDKTNNAKAAAVFYLNEHGMGILAVAPDFSGDLQEERLIKLCQHRLPALFCLMGPAEHLLRLQFTLPMPAIATTRYSILEKPGPIHPRQLSYLGPVAWPDNNGGLEWHGLSLRRARVGDAPLMFDLQASYELEEVLVKGHHLNPEQTRRQLEFNLKHHCIWLASSGELMVAKAGTNAQTWRYAQIGGVFTLPSWRNRGIGEQLMKALLQDIFSAGFGACLFVKRANSPALQLYDKLGFTESGELIISYF